MGKHDKLSHYLHTSKKMKFSGPKPTEPTNISSRAPGQAPVGTNARNQFR